jgi:uncharacterized protein
MKSKRNIFKYKLIQSSRIIIHQIGNRYFFFNLNNGLFAEIDQSFYKILEPWDGRDVSILEESLREIYAQEDTFNILQALDLGNKTKNHSKPSTPVHPDNRTLSNLWLHVTDHCNLKCTYCFHNESTKQSNLMKMDISSARQAVDYLFSNRGARQLGIHFFGGEPLLNFTLIQALIPYIDLKEKEENVRVNYSISTNAVNMTREMASFLKENKFFVTVSIDGDEENHNRTRPLNNGKGSFSEVKKGVQILKEFFPHLTARITLTKQSVGHLAHIFDVLFEMGFSSVAYKFVGVHENELIDSNEDINVFSREFEKIVDRFYDDLINQTPHVVDRCMGWLQKIYRKPAFSECSFALDGKFVVDPKGDFYRCQETVGDQRFIIGNLKDGIDLQKHRPLLPPKLDKRLGCKECWLNGYCDGGCYYANYTRSHDFEHPVTENCKENKKSFMESLLLYTALYMENPDLIDPIIHGEYLK